MRGLVFVCIAACGSGSAAEHYKDVQVIGQGFGMFPSIAFGDLDGDGQTEFILATNEDFIVFRDDGHRTYQPDADLGAVGGNPVAVADFDGDGRDDYITTGSEGGLVVVLAVGPLQPQFVPARAPVDLYVGTFFGNDAAVDVLEVGPQGVFGLRNDGCGLTGGCKLEIAAMLGVADGGVGVPGRLGGGGPIDIAYVTDNQNLVGGTVHAIQVNATGITDAASAPVADFIRGVATADLDGDGQDEIIVTTIAGIEVWGLSSGTLSQRQLIPTLTAGGVYAGHLASDSELEIAVTTNDSRVDTYNIDGGQLQRDASLDTQGVVGQQIFGHDLDGDGLDELFVVGNGQLAVMRSR